MNAPAAAVALDAIDHRFESHVEVGREVIAQAAHARDRDEALDARLVLDVGGAEGHDARVPALDHAARAPALRLVLELGVLRGEVLRTVIEAAVVGLARRQAAAWRIALVENDDVEAAPAQRLRTRQPGDPRADDSDARSAQVLADSDSGSGQSRM